VIDISTGSRRDVTGSVGRLSVSKSGRFAVAIDYDRQHAVAVHCLDGLWRQLAHEDFSAGLNRQCPGYTPPERQTQKTAKVKHSFKHYFRYSCHILRFEFFCNIKKIKLHK